MINAGGNGLDGKRDSQKDTGIEGRVQQGCFGSGGNKAIAGFFEVLGEPVNGSRLIVDRTVAVIQGFEVGEGCIATTADGFGYGVPVIFILNFVTFIV